MFTLSSAPQSVHVAETRNIESFVIDYGPRLLSYIRRFIGHEHDAEDVCSETLLAAIRGLREGSYDVRRGTRVSTWIYGIAYHKIQHHIRNTSRRNRRIRFADPAVLSLTPSKTCIHPADEVRESLRFLSELDRRIIQLHWYAQWGLDEVANDLKMSHEVVKKRHQKAMRRLRDVILHARLVDSGGLRYRPHIP